MQLARFWLIAISMNNPFRTLCRGLVTIALVGAAGSYVFANTITLNTNAYSDAYRGGEFTAVGTGLSTASYGSTALLGGGFETFCMSYVEEFSPGQPYSFTLGPASLGPTIPLSNGVAWLYSQFAAGTLAGYNYGTTGSARYDSAGQLQLAIWWLQNEENGQPNAEGAPGAGGGYRQYDSSNIFEFEAVSAFGGVDNAMSAASPSSGVSVMILRDAAGGLVQPQLYYIPDGGATIALLGAALMAIAAFRRRLV